MAMVTTIEILNVTETEATVRLSWPNPYHRGETCVAEGGWNGHPTLDAQGSAKLLWGYPDNIDQCHALNRRVARAVKAYLQTKAS